jgi:hypothetical protein
MPPVIINQGMKRQPMAAYRIREILSDSDQDRDSPQSVDDKDQYQASLAPSDHQLSQSASGAKGYEDGLPVGDFLAKELHHTNIKEGEY